MKTIEPDESRVESIPAALVCDICAALHGTWANACGAAPLDAESRSTDPL